MEAERNEHKTREDRRSILSREDLARCHPLVKPQDASTQTWGEIQLRVRALEMYADLKPVADITRATGLKPHQVRALARRFNQPIPGTATPTGFAVCYPGYKSSGKRMRRRRLHVWPEHAASGGMTGALQYTLDRFEGLRKRLEGYYVQRSIDGMVVSYVRPCDVHEEFLKLLKNAGLGPADWPFNTRDRGARSIRTWCAALRLQYPLQAVDNLSGEKAKNNAAHTYSATRSSTPVPALAVNQRWEGDATPWDMMFSVSAVIDGRIQVLARALRGDVYAIREVGSGVVAANHLAFSRRNVEWHVLRCVRQAFEPYRRVQLLPELCYPEGACFPSELNGWQPFRPMTLAWDNHPVQRHLALAKRLKWALGVDVVAEGCATGVYRCDVEHVFKLLAESSKQGPNATGSHPDSPARRSPEKASEHYAAQHAQMALDLIFADFNTAPRRGRVGSAILEYEDALRTGQGLFMPLTPAQEGNLYWTLAPQFPVTLRKEEKRADLYVQAAYAQYTSAELTEWSEAGRYLNNERGGLSLFILDDASRAVLCRPVPGREGSLQKLFDLRSSRLRRWSRPHQLIERLLVYQLPEEGQRAVMDGGSSMREISSAMRSANKDIYDGLATGMADWAVARREHPELVSDDGPSEDFISKQDHTEYPEPCSDDIFIVGGRGGRRPDGSDDEDTFDGFVR